MRPKRKLDAREASAIALSVAVILLMTPARRLWAFPAAPFWAPWAMWLGLVGLGVWVARQRQRP